MQLLDLLFRRNDRRRISSLVAETARLSLASAVGELGERLSHMSLAESRGYIRARVRLTVEDQAVALFSGSGLATDRSMQAVVAERALDRVVARLVAEQARRQFVPAAEIRRAA